MLYRFFSGDFPITITLLLILGFWARGRRSLIRDLVSGDSPAWNRLGQVTLGAVVAASVWVAVADNWRQILAYALSPGQRWMGDPFETPPTPDVLRVVSLVLLAVAILGLATLFARHRGSLVLALFWAALSFGFFYFLNPIRLRVDVLMRGTEASLKDPHVMDVAFIVFWAAGLYILIAMLILAAATVLFTAATLPVSAGYRIAMRGRAENEAEVFSLISRRARSLHEAERTDDGHESGLPPGERDATVT